MWKSSSKATVCKLFNQGTSSSGVDGAQRWTPRPTFELYSISILVRTLKVESVRNIVKFALVQREKNYCWRSKGELQYKESEASSSSVCVAKRWICWRLTRPGRKFKLCTRPKVGRRALVGLGVGGIKCLALCKFLKAFLLPFPSHTKIQAIYSASQFNPLRHPSSSPSLSPTSLLTSILSWQIQPRVQPTQTKI